MAENNDFAMGYALGQDNGGGGNDGFGFGGGWGGLIGLLIVASLFGGGWGMGGFGFGGMGGGMMLNGIATRADINEGFALQGITSGITGIQNGLCDGFHNQTVATMQGFTNLGHQISDCCCATQRAIDGVNFNLSKGLCDIGNVINMQTRDIIDNQNANYRSMMDFMVQEKLSAKDARIAELSQRNALSEQSALFGAQLDAAKAEILRRTGHDYPTAAYLVQPPTTVNFPTNGCGTVQFGGWGGNGCGCAA